MPISNAPKKPTVSPAEFVAPSDGDSTRDVVTSDAAETRDRVAQDEKAVQAESASQANAKNVRAEEDAAVKNAPAEDEYIYVEMPDGSYRAIRRNQVQRINEISNADGTPEVIEQDVYLWLADGSVERVAESQAPGAAGTNAAYGFFERDGHMFHVVAVHPVESPVAKK